MIIIGCGVMKKCLHCGVEVEEDDNFCPECGHWTARGYIYFNNQDNKKIINGKVVKQDNRIAYLFTLLLFSVIFTLGICMYRGQNILKPFVYLKRQVMNYKYGYNTTVLKTNNQYFNLEINDLESANKKITEDFNEQLWQCKNNYDVRKIEETLEKNLQIPSVSFCDIPIEESVKISDVINNMYVLFPNIKGYLTNISITNSFSKTDYVAYFQPVYEFVNSTSNLEKYNKVNKTQILLNSYYFANQDILKNPLKENWYVKDATWESLIAHELGHYITYVALLKNKNINSLTLVTKDNNEVVNEIIQIINSGTYSENLVNEAINNYNTHYGMNISIEEFTSNISNYAKSKNSKGNYIYDEIIAEAVHDYYLHQSNSSKESLQIINVLNSRLS